VIGDASEGGDCDEVICAGWGEPGLQWTEWGWRNEEGSWFMRNVAKFREILTSQQFKVIQVIDLGVNWKPICHLLLVINCNFSRICYSFRDIHAWT